MPTPRRKAQPAAIPAPPASAGPDTRAWLRHHGIRPRRHWGQNFLVNPGVTERLVRGWDLGPDTGVLEIGSGAGALTMPLLARGLTVVAVERDRDLCALLARRRDAEGGAHGAGDLRIIGQDVLTLEPSVELDRPGTPRRWVLVGNLPYAITAPILKWTVRHRERFDWAALMMQREVAGRLLAVPGSGAYGSLTLWVGYHFRVERELAVGAANFWPMPKVESVVVRLTPHGEPPVGVPSAEAFERTVRGAFSHRRKMIAGSLARGLGLDREAATAALRTAGIDPRRRAETCSMEELAALTRELVAGGNLEGDGACGKKG